MSLEDRIDDLEDSIDSQFGSVKSDIEELEQGLEQTDYQVDDLHSEFTIFRNKVANEITDIKKALGLVTSPDPKDLEKFATLKEAFDKYQFVKRMTLGDD